jgi:XTP/dITP diphosphohydrolase
VRHAKNLKEISPNVVYNINRSKGKTIFEYFYTAFNYIFMQIIFATNNENKIREIRNILGDSFTLLSLSDINMKEDIPENEPTLEGNALHKARVIYDAVKMNVFADDTGLEIEALGNLPGVNSARFAGENKDSQANIEKVLSMLGTGKNRKARFRTVIVLIFNGKEYLFEGIVTGTIINDKRGKKGFGYDPVFVPEGKNLTFAEMELDEKNTISHRARAFEKLKSFLSRHYVPDNKEVI